MSAPPAARPIGNQVKSIAPRSASRHPSQFPEALRPAASGPRARVSGPQPRQSPPGGRSGPRPARSTTRPAGPKSERIVCTGKSVTSLSPSHQPGPRPAHAPSSARQSAPGSDPDPGPRLRHWSTSQYPMAVTARRLVSRHPSQYPWAHGPSVPRARLGGPCNVWPTRLSRRADAEPSDRRPSPASLSVPGATIRPPSIAGLRSALGQAPSTAPQRPPGYRSRPRPAPPPLGAAPAALRRCGPGLS